MELISVIVPVYNMDKYVNRAIDSLLHQTYKDYEIILVDDGSTDKSGDICDEFARNEEIIRVVHKVNGGLSSARNVGMDHAKGKYVIFPDPDDWVEPNYLQFLYDLQQKYDVNLAISGHFVDDNKGSRVHNKNGKECILTRNESLELVLRSYGFCGFAWNKLYNLELIKEYDLKFNLEFGMAQDLYFAFEYLLKCERVAYNPIPTYHYFQHEGGVTNSSLTKRKVSGLLTFQSLRELAMKEAPFVADIVSGTIANLCLTFIYIYFDTKMNDKEMLTKLCASMKENKKNMLYSGKYSKYRKIFLHIACICPKTFYVLRKVAKVCQ